MRDLTRRIVRRVRKSVRRLGASERESHAGRAVTVLPDDAFIVSYPRSGNTWARFLLGNVLAEASEPSTFRNIQQRIPDIYRGSDRSLLELPRPRVLKSHEPYDPRYGKVLYLVRDPVDVALSYFYYMMKFRKIDGDYAMARFVERFLDGELDDFGTWGGHVNGWLDARRDDPNFLLARYEDLRAAPVEHLARMAKFLGVEAATERVSEAVRLASADRMREAEKEMASEWRHDRNARDDIYFVRAGASDAERDAAVLSDDLRDRIRGRWPDVMAELGYTGQEPAEPAISADEVGGERR